MPAQPTDLIAQRCRGDLVLLRLPLRPLFPRTAANPASHNEDAETICLVEESIVLVVSLEAERIKVHVEGVLHLRILTLGLRPEENVRRPATATNQNPLAVYA